MPFCRPKIVTLNISGVCVYGFNHSRCEFHKSHFIFFGWQHATENPMARTAAGSRSGMDEYELHDHLSELLFRAVGGYVANFSSSVSRISEKSYSQQAVYLSYTSEIVFEFSQVKE